MLCYIVLVRASVALLSMIFRSAVALFSVLVVTTVVWICNIQSNSFKCVSQSNISVVGVCYYVSLSNTWFLN